MPEAREGEGGGVGIRTATAADLDALRAVYRAASLSNEDDRAALLAHPEALVFAGEHVGAGRTRVALVDGAVVGFATVVPLDGGRAELEDLFVAPELMRRGIGAALVRDAAARLVAAGGSRIEVVANDHAGAFYRACGFTGEDPVPTPFGTGRRMVLDVGGQGR